MKEDKYVISGGQPISGVIKCMGAKNLATKVMLAALLADTPSTLYNVPEIGDVDITYHMLQSSGATAQNRGNGVIHIDPTSISNANILLPDSRTNRIPILALSILLQKMKSAIVPVVGGDNIGQRNIDFHINALKSFGAELKLEDGKYFAQRRDRLKGTTITLPYPSVGATETCLFLSVLAEGSSLIKNAAIEPEIIELITMLNLMGSIIIRQNDRDILVHGVDKLHGTHFEIMGDRIEAASWASLAGASDGEIYVQGIRPSAIYNFLPYYNMAGGGYEILDENSVRFYRRSKLHAVSLETDVYPGFSTDWQQPFATMLTQAEGKSQIHETVHENRFGYLNILHKLGANTSCHTDCAISHCRYSGHKHRAIITGKTPLVASDEELIVPDIRAGLAYIIAAVVATGDTLLNDNVRHIDRGYGDIIKKLSNTNIKIRKI